MSKGQTFDTGCLFSIGSIVCIIAVAAYWLVTGHLSREFLNFALIFIGIFMVVMVRDMLQTILNSILKIEEYISNTGEQMGEINEKIVQIEDSIGQINDRIPGRKSLLDDY